MINAKGGTDTLNVTVVDGNNGLPAGAELNDLEVVNFKNTSAIAADASEANANTFTDKGTFATTATSASNSATVTTAIDASVLAGVEQIWQEKFAVGSVTNVAADQTIGFRNTESDDLGTVTAAAAATSASVAFDGAAYDTDANGEIDLTVGGATGSKLDTINLSGTIAKPAGKTDSPSVNLDADIGAGAESFTLNTAVDTTITLDKAAASTADVTTIDASQSTGDITVGTIDGGSNGGFDNVETIKLGAGKDSLTVGQFGEDTTVDLGAGNDTITVNFHGATQGVAASQNLDITLGDGNDVLKFGAFSTATGAVDEAQLTDSLATVTDFEVGTDVIDVDAGNTNIVSFATQGTIDGLIDENKSLFENVEAVIKDSATTNTNIAQFEFGGDTYLVADQGTAGTYGEEDVVIKLAGVTEVLTGADVEGIA